MGLLDRLKSFSLKKQEEKIAPKEEWELAKEVRLSDVERYKKYVKDYSEKINEYNKQGTDKNSYEYRDAVEQLNRFKYALFEAEKSIDFIRPNTTEDIEYRNNLYDSFADNLKNVLPENLDLRFHGTPVYFAKEILESKQISSSADRFDGYISSTDSSGEISVADINGVPRVVDYFLDVPAHQRFLPCGCLFVLTGEGQTERQRKVSVMDNVDFGKNPERLYAVVTTPENISNVQNWLSDAGFSPNKAHSFDGFIEHIRKQKEQMKSISVNSKKGMTMNEWKAAIAEKRAEQGHSGNNEVVKVKSSVKER